MVQGGARPGAGPQDCASQRGTSMCSTGQSQAMHAACSRELVCMHCCMTRPASACRAACSWPGAARALPPSVCHSTSQASQWVRDLPTGERNGPLALHHCAGQLCDRQGAGRHAHAARALRLAHSAGRAGGLCGRAGCVAAYLSSLCRSFFGGGGGCVDGYSCAGGRFSSAAACCPAQYPSLLVGRAAQLSTTCLYPPHTHTPTHSPTLTQPLAAARVVQL